MFVVVLLVVAVVVVILIAQSKKKKQPKMTADGFVQAEYGVPHCKFERTAEGFKVEFKNMGLGVHRAAHKAVNNKGVAAGVGGLIGVGLVAAVDAAKGVTKIEVTRNAVIIDDRKLRRDDFAGFNVSKTWKGSHLEGNVAVLGYRYGSQGFEFGGAWDEGKATEVASALNNHLRQTPMAGDETQASPELLRAARPTDF